MRKKYRAMFLSPKGDTGKIEEMMDRLAKKDPTFYYVQRYDCFTFDDTDKKRAFRRALWLKRALCKRGVFCTFTFNECVYANPYKIRREVRNV